MKKTTGWIVISSMAILLAVLLVFIDKFHLPYDNISDGITAIISAFIGILFTISATSILINSQSNVERQKEKDMMQFSKKQETYHNFLMELEKAVLIILSRSISNNDSKKFENIDTLGTIIFEFGNLRMHMPEEIFLQTMDRVSEIFKVYRESSLASTYREEIQKLQNENKTKSIELNSRLYNLFKSLASQLLEISKILHQDLYGVEADFDTNDSSHIEEYISRFLNNCGLETKL